MKLSDDELPVKDVPPKHSKKDKKKNKRAYDDFSEGSLGNLEDLDENEIDQKLKEYGIEPDAILEPE